jgi:hypothetical protein
MRLFRPAKFLVISLLLAVCGFAQSGSSTVAGTAKDPVGAMIPRDKVKVVNEQTGSALDTLTNDTGIYRVGSLLPGSYRLEVEFEGFQRLVRGGVTVEVGRLSPWT